MAGLFGFEGSAAEVNVLGVVVSELGGEVAFVADGGVEDVGVLGVGGLFED